MTHRPANTLNVREVAEMLGCSRGTVYNYLEYGWLKRYKIRGTDIKVFKRSEVEAFRDGELIADLDPLDRP